ncbi:MAG: class I SAM-dependent methyltransferase, partial [Actinomycetota bacterium]|nr:class I SAM-dependent methyltransferase [Actinomycetota bacterium]
VSTPQQEWSGDVLDRLQLSGSETVVDAGCGSGEVTARLLARLPRGRVIAVDGSPNMAERARERLATEAAEGRVDFSCQNLARLELPRTADRVFSNAVFHWIPDHPELFRRLAAVLKPGGRLVAQYGGRGNVAEAVAGIESVLATGEYDEWLSTYRIPWTFNGPEETAGWLEEAGFEAPECWLQERLASPEDPRGFFAASFLAPVRELLPEERFDEFLDRTMTAMGQPSTFNYIRLNIDARRA